MGLSSIKGNYFKMQKKKKKKEGQLSSTEGTVRRVNKFSDLHQLP